MELASHGEHITAVQHTLVLIQSPGTMSVFQHTGPKIQLSPSSLRTVSKQYLYTRPSSRQTCSMAFLALLSLTATSILFLVPRQSNPWHPWIGLHSRDGSVNYDVTARIESQTRNRQASSPLSIQLRSRLRRAALQHLGRGWRLDWDIFGAATHAMHRVIAISHRLVNSTTSLLTQERFNDGVCWRSSLIVRKAMLVILRS